MVRFKKRVLLLSLFFIGVLVLQSAAMAAAIAPPGGGGGTVKFRLYGYVKKSGTSIPISGATVKFYEEGMTYRGYTTTSSSGYFDKSIYLSSFPEFWELRVTKSGYNPASKIVMNRGTTINVGTVYMSQIVLTYTIHGYVTNIITGDPIPGAHVDLYRDNYEGWSWIGETTSRTFGDIGYFTYNYQATDSMAQCKAIPSKTGYYSGVTVVDVSGTDVDMGDVHLFPPQTVYTTQGTVFDYSTGQQVSGTSVKVYAYYDGDWNFEGYADTNGNNGQFVELTGTYYPNWEGVRIEVSKAGYPDARRVLMGPGANYVYDFANVYLNSPATKFAVIVGIDDYKDDSVNDLPYSHEDANEWYEYLIDIQNVPDSNTWVFGDDQTANYTKYSGLATESAVKSALVNVVNLADENDIFCFIMTGHGGGGNDCYASMWDLYQGEEGEDGKFWDYEFSDIFEDTVAAQVFIFLSTCSSGGVIPEIQSLPNHESFYVTTHCGPDGAGYQYSEIEMSFWTHWFLVNGLRSWCHDDPTVPLEIVFEWADDRYGVDGDPDNPMEYDGNSIDNDFCLTQP